MGKRAVEFLHENPEIDFVYLQWFWGFFVKNHMESPTIPQRKTEFSPKNVENLVVFPLWTKGHQSGITAVKCGHLCGYFGEK